jgi:hypothetical protein
MKCAWLVSPFWVVLVAGPGLAARGRVWIIVDWLFRLVGGFSDGEFDPGSGRTLAACLTHASRTDASRCLHCGVLVANG